IHAAHVETARCFQDIGMETFEGYLRFLHRGHCCVPHGDGLPRSAKSRVRLSGVVLSACAAGRRDVLSGPEIERCRGGPIVWGQGGRYPDEDVCAIPWQQRLESMHG